MEDPVGEVVAVGGKRTTAVWVVLAVTLADGPTVSLADLVQVGVNVGTGVPVTGLVGDMLSVGVIVGTVVREVEVVLVDVRTLLDVPLAVELRVCVGLPLMDALQEHVAVADPTACFVCVVV